MNKTKKQIAFSINFLLLLLILLFSIIYPVSVQAEGELSTVSYQYKDLETLTNLEKKDIIKGNPKEVLSNDFENYIFVYERKKTKEVNSTTPKSNINKTLPKTNEQLFNTNTLIIGLLITGLSLYIFVYKKKKIDKILIIFILLGGLGLNTYVNKVKAVEINLLKPSTIVKLPKGAVSNLEPENLSGYNYIGYIYTSENKIKPIKVEVTVYYQDVSGQPLASTEVLTGNVGDSYTSKQKDIPGYTFKEVKEDNATGKFTATSQSVHYIYTKDVVKGAEVTVYYQDISGQPLASTEVLTGNVGDSYTSKQKDIPGYTFKEVKGEMSGVISNSTISIVYIYNANSAKLIIQFVDKNSLLPTHSINLLTYSDGSLINNHPNISDYYYVRNIAGETERIEQNVPLEDIVYNVKMGDSIKVPSKISFDLYNEQGELLSKIDNGNPDYLHYSGFTDYRGELIPFDNTIVTEAVTIIKYAVTITPIAIPF